MSSKEAYGANFSAMRGDSLPLLLKQQVHEKTLKVDTPPAGDEAALASQAKSN